VIRHSSVQDLWKYDDQGMPVFAHTMDVAGLVVDAYPDWRDRFPEFRFDVVLLGSVLHDLTKASARGNGEESHSAIMEREPTIAVRAAVDVLDAIARETGMSVDSEGVDHLWHVIAAHHGPWGKVAPRTPEAALLFQCDNYSATHRRLAPFDANDVLPLLSAGKDVPAAAAALGFDVSALKRRLREAMRAEGLQSREKLVLRWNERGAVAVGDVTRVRQIEEAKAVIGFARACPKALVERVRMVLVRNTDVPGWGRFAAKPGSLHPATSAPVRSRR
jgi:hypothetical protein